MSTIAAEQKQVVVNLFCFDSEQQAMSKLSHFVGLDYHQHCVQVRAVDSKGNIIRMRLAPNPGAKSLKSRPKTAQSSQQSKRALGPPTLHES